MNTTLSAPMMSSGVSPPQPASVVILLTKPWKADWDLGNRKKVFVAWYRMCLHYYIVHIVGLPLVCTGCSLLVNFHRM